MAKSPVTNLPEDILRRPPQEAARLLAIGFLDEAAANLEKLEKVDDGDDGEALHDFRVSIRRLRSTLRAYERELGGAVSKKVRKRLKELWRSTSSGRDTEVQLQWIEEQKERMAPDQELGFDWMIKRLEARRDESYATISREIGQAFARIESNLRRKLSSYRMRVRREPLGSEPAFCAAAQSLIAEHAGELEDRLEALKRTREHEDTHRARISVKRLRYVLEPLARCMADGEEIIRDSKELQDVLGELQDAHVLGLEIGSALEEAAAEKARRLHDLALREDARSEKLRNELEQDERAGILELARLLKTRQEELYASLESEWLNGRTDALLDTLDRSSRGMTGESRDGAKSVEIERKYLLTGLPPRAKEQLPDEIEQGWVRTEDMEERLRRVRSPDRETFWRTFKVGTGLKRTQIEEEIPRELFEALWPFTGERRVVKKRYKIEEGGFVWEIDEFLDRDLHLAEVELPSEETRVDPPSWLEPFIEEEVTGNPRYSNVSLARAETRTGDEAAVEEADVEKPLAG